MKGFTFRRDECCLLVDQNVATAPDIRSTTQSIGFSGADVLRAVAADLRAAGYQAWYSDESWRLIIGRASSCLPRIEKVLADAGWRGWVQYGPESFAPLSYELPVNNEASVLPASDPDGMSP